MKARKGVTVAKLPDNYRRGGEQGHYCRNCRYGHVGSNLCTLWWSLVDGSMLCNSWEDRK